MRMLTLLPDIEQVEQKVNLDRSQASYVVTACSLPNSALHRIAARWRFCLKPNGYVWTARGELAR